MKITVGNYTLFDSTQDGWALSDLDGEIARLIQVSSPIRAEEISAYNRGAKRSDFSFTVSKPHTDEASTLMELLWEESKIPTQGNIIIEGPVRGGGVQRFYFRGKFQALRLWHVGLRSFKTYRFVCGKPRLTKP